MGTELPTQTLSFTTTKGIFDLLVTCLATLLAFLVLGGIIHRLFASPLACLPGPRLAALTYWYECYYDVLVHRAQFVCRIKKLHSQYGPVVRITPTEVSVADPDFLNRLYAPGPGHMRDKDIEKVKGLGINTSIGGAVAHELHKKRREALNPFFSHQSVGRFAPKLNDKIQQLDERFSQSAKASEPVNLSDLYFGLANDIVNEYCFGHNQDLLGSPERANIQRENVNGVLRGVKFNLHFSWVRSLMRKLPFGIAMRLTPPGIRDMIRFRMGIRQEISRVLNHDMDEKDSTIHHKSIFYGLRDSPTLPEPEKSPQRLEDEATLLVMAGTQSTQLSLTIAHYHLIKNDKIMSKLRDELISHPSSTLSELEQLPYLNGVIQEAHRLGFGLTGRNPRVSPNEPIEYKDRSTGRAWVFPPGTSISVSTLLVHADEDIFPDPYAFDPERWLGESGSRNKKYQMAFSKGPRMCIGMHLANAEMAMAIAAMSRWDMALHKTNDRDVAFLHDYHIATPRLDSKGVRASVIGRAT